MNRLIYIGLLLIITANCNGQTQNTDRKNQNFINRVGGDCGEGYCDLMYYGMAKKINSVDTSAGWYEKGQKLVVKGTVYQLDGKTPAPDVIIYYHQTDNNGNYSPRNDKPENQTRHGHIRGWVKSDKEGEYTLNTIRPVTYPNTDNPAHIHLIIKEPDIQNEYWIDDIVFDDDPLLLPYRKKHPVAAPRCGSGTLRVLLKDGLQTAEHKIILGLNIPNYPEKTKK